MTGVLIVQPVAPAATPTVGGTGADFLLTADPNEVWLAPSTAPIEIRIDMGAAVSIDSFLVGFTNAAAGASWSISTMTGMGTGYVARYAGTLRAADSLGPRHHGFVRLAAPVVSRYFSITLTQSGAEPIYAGALCLGLAFEKWREYGPGRTLIDTGARSDLVSGGFGTGDGVVKAQFAFSFIDLTESEVQQLWAIKYALGIRKPVVIVEDADLAIGRNEAIHYGVFERFQPYERQDAGSTRWAGSVVQWV